MSKNKPRFQLFSDDEFSSDISDDDNDDDVSTKKESESVLGGKEVKEVNPEQIKKFQELKSVLKLVNPQKYNMIPKNTRVCYWTVFNTIIFNKYFKEIKKDDDSNTILRVGFFTSDKRNYTIPLKNIKKIYTYGYIHENNKEEEEVEDPLKNTILIKKNEWEKIPSGTTISYKKSKNNKFTYRVKFNSFVESEKRGRLISLTNVTGFNYVIKPNSISEIYRHILPMDFTIIQLLESVNVLKKRISALENIVIKKK